MKKILYWILLLTSSNSLYSQDNDYISPTLADSNTKKSPVISDKAFQAVEQMPEYPGGETVLMNMVQTNLRYPEDAIERRIQGRIVVSFIVREDGTLDSIFVKKKVWPTIDAEVMRVIRLTKGKWKPGTQQGKAVAVRFDLPIQMKLSGGILMAIYNPDAFDKNEKKGFRAYIGGNYTAALKLFKAAHDADPSNFFATHNLGLCLYQTGDHDGACTIWHSLMANDIHISDLLIDTYCKSAK